MTLIKDGMHVTFCLFRQLYKLGRQNSNQGEDNIRFATEESGFVASSWITRHTKSLFNLSRLQDLV